MVPAQFFFLFFLLIKESNSYIENEELEGRNTDKKEENLQQFAGDGFHFCSDFSIFLPTIYIAMN